MRHVNLPEANGSAHSMALYVTSLEGILAAASDNFERIKVRDDAERLQGLAKALGLKKVETKCSVIVRDAEYLTNENIPIQQGKRNDLDPDFQKLPLSTNQVKEFRKSYGGLSHDQFNGIKQDALDREEPLSRKQVENRKKAILSRDDAPLIETSAGIAEVREPKKPNLTPQEQDIISLRRHNDELKDRITDYEERIALMTSGDPDIEEINKRWEQQAEVIKTLRDQMNNWMSRHARCEERCKALRKMAGVED